MRIGKRIEQVRKECGFSVVYMCNALATDEAGYRRLITGKDKPTIYQLIMFMSATCHSI